MYSYTLCCLVQNTPFSPTAKFTCLVPKPRLWGPKPMLGIPMSTPGDPKHRDQKGARTTYLFGPIATLHKMVNGRI